MEHRIIFSSEADAMEAESIISNMMGLPKYAVRPNGSINNKVIIDRFAIPVEHDGSWSIPVPEIDGWDSELKKFGIDHQVIETAKPTE